jgi:hypothetical protein
MHRILASSSSCRSLLKRLDMVASVVILKPMDVVLAGVGAPLDLDDYKFLIGMVSQAVLRSTWHVDTVARSGRRGLALNGACGESENHDPVFRTMVMGLTREPSVRLHVDTLDLVSRTGVYDLPHAPRAFLEVERHAQTVRHGSGSGCTG